MTRDFGDYIRGRREAEERQRQEAERRAGEQAGAEEVREAEAARAQEQREQEMAEAATVVQRIAGEAAEAYNREGLLPNKSFSYDVDRDPSERRLFRNGYRRVKAKGWELFRHREVLRTSEYGEFGTWARRERQINETYSSSSPSTSSEGFSYVLGEDGQLFKVGANGGELMTDQEIVSFVDYSRKGELSSTDISERWEQFLIDVTNKLLEGK